jgi:hypothetical protein
MNRFIDHLQVITTNKYNTVARDPQQMAQCIYSIPCERSRSYIGETGRPLAVQLHEHGTISNRIF